MTTTKEPEYVKITPRTAIDAFCCECVGNVKDMTEIRLCPSRGKCPLYALRPFKHEGETDGYLTKEQFLGSRGFPASLSKQAYAEILKQTISKAKLLDKINHASEQGRVKGGYVAALKKKALLQGVSHVESQATATPQAAHASENLNTVEV